MRTEDIKALKATGFGWMTPEGEILACTLHEHLTVLADRPDVGVDYAAYKAQIDLNAQIMDDTLSSLGEDDHPEMHRFDGMDDDARDALISAAYHKGWIRLGTFREKFQPPAGAMRGEHLKLWRNDPSKLKLEAEGLDPFIEARRKDLRDLAAILEVGLVLREMAVVPEGAYGKQKPPQTMLLSKEARKALSGEA